MTDKEKLAKVIAEIERLMKDVKIHSDIGDIEHDSYYDGRRSVLCLIRDFIDSMQEEPKECMYSKDNYTDENRKVLCGGCEEDCRFNKKEESVNNGIDLGCGVIWKDVEPVSEDLKKEINEYISILTERRGNFPKITKLGFRTIARHFANWQKEQLMAKAVKVKISNTSIVSLPVNCNLKVGDKVLIIKED